MSLPNAFVDTLRLPLVCAPMFLVSGPGLVIEACRSGVVGTFPALNQRDSAGFEAWLLEVKEALADTPNAAPYGVNLIVHKSNPRLQADLELCVKHQVPLVITSLGAVSEVVDAVHSYGGVVFHDVINVRHAEKAAQAGVDGLIAVCAGAGGHAGTLSPFALVPEIRQFFHKTVLLAGSLSRGSDILATKVLGADLAYMGTRFINTQESLADARYKSMIANSRAADVVYTEKVSGVNANFLLPSLEVAGVDLAAVRESTDVDFGEELDAAKAWKDIWSAGQGVGSIDDVPSVADLVARLEQEYMAACAAIDTGEQA
ncbi:MAG TPA: 2-nitropropane dioxygenase [Gammaproteobacteria bacterium]|nr:2-nitropropane dioxygenase [Gammaproteobacteria bacterium]